jgi:two-component system, chemotaxis family, protein-glutamate methylesterase/glutaminase
MRPSLQLAGSRTGSGARAQPIRVMIVDDSLTARTVLSRIVEAEPDLEIVAKATTAEMALARLLESPADVILLDLEMPGMGGLEALPKLLERGRGVQVLVVSSLTAEGAEHTLSALSMGAADTLLKPSAGQFDLAYRGALIAKIRALGRGGAEPAAAVVPRAPAAPRELRKAPAVLAIGASTGGIHAMSLLLRALPARFDLPILVTQHLPGAFMPVLARQLELASGREAQVAAGGEELIARRILVAPGDGHLIVQTKGGKLVTGIARHKVRSGCMPSVDPLFETLADAANGCAIGIVLSGMGRDGAEGAAKLAAAGGTLFAQDAATSSVWGMPRAIAEAGLAAAVLPPAEIAARLASVAGVGR